MSFTVYNNVFHNEMLTSKICIGVLPLRQDFKPETLITRSMFNF